MWLGIVLGLILGAAFESFQAAMILAIIGAVIGGIIGQRKGTAAQAGDELGELRSKVRELETQLRMTAQRLERLERRVAQGVAPAAAAAEPVVPEPAPTPAVLAEAIAEPPVVAPVELSVSDDELTRQALAASVVEPAPAVVPETVAEFVPEPVPEPVLEQVAAAALVVEEKPAAEPLASEAPVRTVRRPQPESVQRPPQRTVELEAAPPSWLSEFIARWVLGGNPIVKVGVLILFLGLAFLLRYVAENTVVPVELRYAGVALAGIGMLVAGWRWRGKKDNYGLILQGGGIGVLYLTTLAGMKLHPLIPPELGFVVLIGVAAFAALLAILEDALPLAVVASLGGFAAPVLASTGSEHHFAYFSYLTVLNLGIAAIAWFKAWRPLNLIGFVSTFFLASGWGNKYYQPALFEVAEPFLLFFFILYVLIAFLFARRTLGEAESEAGDFAAQVRASLPRVPYVDASLVFGVPMAAFGMQYLMTSSFEYGPAFSALGFGLLYIVLAFALFRRTGLRYALLSETMVALAVIFGSLALPLGLEGEWTSAGWAIEAAGVYWVGIRQARVHARVFALLLLFGASGYFFADVHNGTATAVLDGSLLGCLLLAGALAWVYRQLRGAEAGILAGFEPRLRPWLAGLAAVFVALAPFLLLAMDWAAPALAVLGCGVLFAALRLPERALVALATLFQLAGGAFYLSTLSSGGSSMLAPVVDGSLPACLLVAGALALAYRLLRLADEGPGSPLTAWLAGLAAAFLALAPFLLLPMDWAAPALAVIGCAVLFAALRLPEPVLVVLGCLFQLAAGGLFFTTLSSGDDGSALASGWGGLFAAGLIGATMLFGAATALRASDENPAVDGEKTANSLLLSPLLLAGLVFVNLAPLFVLPWRLAALVWPLTALATLVWALRAGRPVAIGFALVLQVFTGFVVLDGASLFGFASAAGETTARAFLHAGFWGPLLIALAALAGARLLQRDENDERRHALGWGLLLWSMFWWAYGWGEEMQRLLPASTALLALVAVAMLTMVFWQWLMHRFGWREIGQATLVYLPVLALLHAAGTLAGTPHPLADWGIAAWPFALFIHGRLLRAQEDCLATVAQQAAHVFGAWLFIFIGASEVHWQFAQFAGAGGRASAWGWFGWLPVPLLALWLFGVEGLRARWPLADWRDAYGVVAAPPLLFLMLVWGALGNFVGSVAPLPYLPLLNPVELGQVAVLIVLLRWWSEQREAPAFARSGPLVAGAAGIYSFVLISTAVLRACHHWGGVAWNSGALGHSLLAQASLSIVWSLTAIGLMLFAHRRGLRFLWLAGAALVALVVAKLFLVELAASGSLERIVSFIVVGLLLLLVGYFAPLPPRREETAGSAA